MLKFSAILNIARGLTVRRALAASPSLPVPSWGAGANHDAVPSLSAGHSEALYYGEHNGFTVRVGDKPRRCLSHRAEWP
jgi:hypothetical protein